MRKISMLLAIGAIISFASCKKEFTCTCQQVGGEPYDVTAKGKTASEACADESSIFSLKTCVEKK